MVDSSPDYYLGQIRDMLVNQTYKVSEYEIFERKEGEKLRKIYKLPYFPDRIIQWAVILVIGPFLESKFISTTYSSIKKRGQHKCLKDTSAALHKVYNNEYCLKIDIKKFYPSINHSILKAMYSKIFKDKKLLDFIALTIDSVKEDEGVPIGNYLSQYSGNLYLTYFDHYVKEKLKIKNYFRYMDDMVFLSNSKQELRFFLDKIDLYLKENLKLTIKSNYQIYPVVVRGIDFVGYRIFPKYLLVRKKNAQSYKKLVLSLKNKKELTNSQICSYMSYKGLLCHANTFNLINKYNLEVQVNEGRRNNKTTRN